MERVSCPKCGWRTTANARAEKAAAEAARHLPRCKGASFR